MSLGEVPIDPKSRQGDGRTPEGRYLIDRHNPMIGFHRALHVEYPICGRASIAAATIPVERVVPRHLREQMDALHTVDPQACTAIEAIVRDEQSHHDKALLEPRKGIFWPWVLLPVISWATEGVIWMGMRL